MPEDNSVNFLATLDKLDVKATGALCDSQGIIRGVLKIFKATIIELQQENTQLKKENKALKENKPKSDNK